MLGASKYAARSLHSRSIASRAHTLISPTSDSLSAHLSQFPPISSTPTIYLLSTSIPQHELSPLVTALQAIPNSIGSFTTSKLGDPPSLSIASLPGAKAWHSTITGRPAAEVGKYQRPSPFIWGEDQKGIQAGEIDRILSGKDGEWADMWKVGGDAERISDLEGVKVESLLVLADGTPNTMLQTLGDMCPSATMFGMVTAPTPFISSRPYTLFYNERTLASGAVGLAFDQKLHLAADYGLEPLTDKARVVAAQGNMLLQLDGPVSNPTKNLMAALLKRGSKMTKEEEFYLSIHDGHRQRIVKVLSGDPSRGALALETDIPISSGQTVQFLQRSPDRDIPSVSAGVMGFATLPRPEIDDAVTRGRGWADIERRGLQRSTGQSDLSYA